jgi:hypothetical protein
MEVEHNVYVDEKSNNIWYKGSRTNTFTVNTSDKQKKRIIEMVNEFILANDEPLIIPFNPNDTQNQR